MSRREKIVVVAMILALVLGGVNFLRKSPDLLLAGKEQHINELNQFIMKAASQLNDNSGKVSDYILKTAAIKLGKDPFLKLEAKKVPVLDQKNPIAEKDEQALHYLGYLQLGHKNIAIINGYEYEPGDAVESHGCIVQQITPEKVILESMGKEKIILLIEE
jgi:hypothetical protein